MFRPQRSLCTIDGWIFNYQITDVLLFDYPGHKVNGNRGPLNLNVMEYPFYLSVKPH